MQENLRELAKYFDELRSKYLDHHIKAQETADSGAGQAPSAESYDLDVRAYCVFVHAAIEQFFEELADYVLASILVQWRSGLPMSRASIVSLISLIAHDGISKLPIEDDEKLNQVKPLHYISDLIINAESKLKRKFQDNHGASLKYLRALFSPLGMSIDPNPNAESGLSRLASSRGAFAHRRTMPRAGYYVYKPISPSDALVAATDCLLFCKELSTQVPKSAEIDAYKAESLYLSAHRANLASVIREVADKKRKTEPSKRLPG
jgi:hypothetical protein